MPKGPQQPSTPVQPFNINANQVATNQESIPIPYFIGKLRTALKWSCSGYNQRVTDVKSSGGGKGGGQTSGHNYYIDIGGFVAMGPVDHLNAIIMDGVEVWTGTLVRDSTNPDHVDVTIPNYGLFRLYWGTETQGVDDLVYNFSSATTVNIDPVDEPQEYQDGNTSQQSTTVSISACPQQHPAYLGICHLVIKQLFCGKDRTSVPNVEVVVERYPRYQPIVDQLNVIYPTNPGVALTAQQLVYEGGNPVVALAELLTNERYGLGISTSYIDATTWAPEAYNRVRQTAMPVPGDSGHMAYMGYLGLFLDKQVSARSFLSDVLTYFDGFIRVNTSGQLALGHFAHDGTVPGGIITLTHHDIDGPPKIECSGFEKTINRINVVFRDVENYLKDTPCPQSDPGARARDGEPREEQKQMQFFMTKFQAQEYALEMVRFLSQPETRIRIKVRREKTAGMTIGDRVIVNYNQFLFNVVCRLLKRTDPAQGATCELELESERSLSPLPYVAPANARPFVTVPLPVVITQAEMFELPPMSVGDPTRTVIPLAVRPSLNSRGYKVYFSIDDASYDEVATVDRWALAGALSADITSGSGSFNITASGLDIVKLQPQSAAAQVDDSLLAIIDGEIMSIGAVTANGGGSYTLNLLRGRQGSTATAHINGATVWVISRDDFSAIAHEDFPRNAGTRYFKLVSFTAVDTQPLANGYRIVFNFTDATMPAPSSLTATGTANGISFKWVNPQGRFLALVQMWIRSASTPVPVDGDTPDVTLLADHFTLHGLNPTDQRWFWLRAMDQQGNLSVIVGGVSGTAIAGAGTPGTPGVSGSHVVRMYIGSRLTPTTPTGDSPAGWTIQMPVGSPYALWVSEASFGADGHVIGSWSAPVRLSGSIVFYQGTAPAPSTYSLLEGDLWFDTSDNFKIYRYTSGSWVSVQDGNIPTLNSGLASEISARTLAVSNEANLRASADNNLQANISTEASVRLSNDNTISANLTTEVSARSSADSALAASVSSEATARASADGSLASEYVLKVVAGNRIAGFRITNLGGGGNSTSMVIQASSLIMVDDSGASPLTPFKVVGGVTFIDRAAIREVDAGAILAGTITATINITSLGTISSLGSLTCGSGGNQTIINGSGIAVGSHLVINGDANQNTIYIGGSYSASLTGGAAGARLALGPYGTQLTDTNLYVAGNIDGGGGTINLQSGFKILCGRTPTGGTAAGYLVFTTFDNLTVYVPFET